MSDDPTADANAARAPGRTPYARRKHPEDLGTGTRDGTKFLRDDGTWQTSGGGGGLTDPTTTKGDLIARGATTTTRLAVGTNTQVLTADSTQATGLAWSTVSSFATRTTAAVTSASLAANAAQQTTITIAKGFRLLHILTDRAARVRVYSTAAGQTADASRLVGNDPAMGVGVILDYVTTSTAKDEDLSPLADGASMEVTPSTSIPITITNLSGATSTVAVTLTYIRTE